METPIELRMILPISKAEARRPLLYLIPIEHTDVLPALYGHVLIPRPLSRSSTRKRRHMTSGRGVPANQIGSKFKEWLADRSRQLRQASA